MLSNARPPNRPPPSLPAPNACSTLYFGAAQVPLVSSSASEITTRACMAKEPTRLRGIDYLVSAKGPQGENPVGPPFAPLRISPCSSKLSEITGGRRLSGQPTPAPVAP